MWLFLQPCGLWPCNGSVESKINRTEINGRDSDYRWEKNCHYTCAANERKPGASCRDGTHYNLSLHMFKCRLVNVLSQLQNCSATLPRFFSYFVRERERRGRDRVTRGTYNPLRTELQYYLRILIKYTDHKWVGSHINCYPGHPSYLRHLLETVGMISAGSYVR